jgi:Flp pilus assembly protein TadG
MVTVEAAIALCAFVTVLAMVLAGVSMVLDELRCTDAAREAARLVARGEQASVADTVHHIAPAGATYTVRSTDEGIVVDVRDPAATGLLPGVHVDADAYAVPEPDVDVSDDGRSAGGGTR